MPDTMMMFEPLSMEERTGGTIVTQSDDKTPIIPVPADAPPMRFRHPKYGYPTAEYAYHVASGELAGYACRFDFIDEDGNPDKEVLPITFCDLGNRNRGWRAKGVPAPRPLYRLIDLSARPDAPVLICEGEKATNAGVPIFPECVPTTPMHGAKSPQQTDWTPLAGRTVVIWADNDPPGRDFAQRVAALVTKVGASAVSIVQVPQDWPEKWDLADPLPEGVDPGVLHQLLTSAAPWEPSNAKEVNPPYEPYAPRHPKAVLDGSDRRSARNSPSAARSIRELWLSLRPGQASKGRSTR